MILEVKVFPGSGKQGWAVDEQGIIKCYIKSQPQGGKANKELLMLLASLLGIPQRELIIVQGLTTRMKRIRIPLESTQEAIRKLIEAQGNKHS